MVDATNSASSHTLIEQAASETKKVLIVGHVLHNKVYLLKPNPESKKRIEEIIAFDAPDTNADVDTPVIIVNSLAGIMLANEALRSVLDKPSQLNNNLLIIKLSDYSFSLQPI